MEIHLFVDSKDELFSQLEKMGMVPTVVETGPYSLSPAAKQDACKQVVKGYFRPERKKIPAIKFVRTMLNLGLKDAKDFVERDCNWPSSIYK